MSEQKCPVKTGYTVIQTVFIVSAIVFFILGINQLTSAGDLNISKYSSTDKLLYYNNLITSAVSLFIASAVSVVFAILAYVKKKEFEKNAEIGNKQLEELSEIKNSLQKLCKSVKTEQQRRNEKDTWICKSCGEIIKLAKGETPANCPKCCGKDFIHQ